MSIKNQQAFICPKSTIETLKKGGIFIVSFQDASHFFLVFLLLTLNIYLFTGKD